MAQDYPLEELSPRVFEQLTVTLAGQVLGDGVESFGSGPDGGREATYTGPVEWSATTGFGADSWNGYVVIQAKQKEHLSPARQNFTWLRSQVSDELDQWVSPTSRRAPIPDYLIFVTNVRLSSVPGSGGIDQIHDFIAERIQQSVLNEDGPSESLAKRGLKAVKVWHRDNLNMLLTKYHGIRHAFKPLLTVGDLLTRLGSLDGLLPPDQFEPVLKAHATRTIITERWVNFREAGGSTRQSVEDVIIDLKVSGAKRPDATILNEVVERANCVLRRSVEPDAKHLVVTGQPGSGKSTATLFLTQMYRVGFLADEDVTDGADAVRGGTAAALHRIEVASPQVRRWPVRVNLAAYADALGPSGDKGLLRWLSERVTARAEIDIKPHALKRWIKHWPSLVVFDGLDEVTSPDVRPRVLDEIRNFVEEADQDDADLLVIVTTRPTGEDERLLPDRFQQLNLQYLDSETAIRYGRDVTNRRLDDDLDRRDQLIRRFERHAEDATMVRLMKTPLQVLIMTMILERFGVLPADRYQLFWRYFETIYERESAKETTLAPLLAEHRRAISELHEAVGLALQRYAETASDARAIMSKADLRGIAVRRLLEVGYERGLKVDRVADQLVQATTERLVLLVPAEEDGVSFEIRSLQELMAARALSSGTDEELRRRLVTAGPSPHWRNTVVFIAGRIFAEGPDHRRDLVVEVVENIDRSEDWPGWLCPVGPELAASLLDDGLAVSTPKWQRRLVDVALRSLHGPASVDRRSLAIGLSAADAQEDRMYVRNVLQEALSESPVARRIAEGIIGHGDFGGPFPKPQGKSVKWGDVPPPASVADLLASKSGELGLSPAGKEALDTVLAEIRASGMNDSWNSRWRVGLDRSLPLTTQALLEDELGSALELLFADLPPERWGAATALSYAVTPDLVRRPIGDRLM